MGVYGNTIKEMLEVEVVEREHNHRMRSMDRSERREEAMDRRREKRQAVQDALDEVNDLVNAIEAIDRLEETIETKLTRLSDGEKAMVTQAIAYQRNKTIGRIGQMPKGDPSAPSDTKKGSKG